MGSTRQSIALLFAVFCAFSFASADDAPKRERPLMRDFMGLNVHTVQFKPDLYAPVCRLVRDYHPFEWDVGNDTSRATTFPMAANRVDWGSMYGSWARRGFEIDVCVMFDGVAAKSWKDPAADARRYGEALAQFVGPSSAKPLATSVEIGNEPAKYSEAEYRAIFENMAKGLRAGDPRLTIATCAVMTGKPDQWSKPMSAVAGLEDCYDVLNVHSYPFKAKWPTWRRSYPEDSSIAFLKEVESVVRWRNDHAKAKQVWLTEFGYDSTTKPPTKDEWKQWEGVTDEQQARYIVRAFLVLSAMDIDRAYLYFFNDKDEAQLHGASGITRDFHPKPSFYAMSQLYARLGDRRFTRAVVRADDLYCFEYRGPDRPNAPVFVAWTPDASDKHTKRVIPLDAATVSDLARAEEMALSTSDAPPAAWKAVDGGIEIEVGANPVYLLTR